MAFNRNDNSFLKLSLTNINSANEPAANSTLIYPETHHSNLNDSEFSRMAHKHASLAKEVEVLKMENLNLKHQLEEKELEKEQFIYEMEQKNIRELNQRLSEYVIEREKEKKILEEKIRSEFNLAKQSNFENEIQLANQLEQKSIELSEMRSKNDKLVEQMREMVSSLEQIKDETEKTILQMDLKNTSLNVEIERLRAELSELKENECSCQNDPDIREFVQMILELRKEFESSALRDASINKTLAENNIDLDKPLNNNNNNDSRINYNLSRPATKSQINYEIEEINVDKKANEKINRLASMIFKQQSKIRNLNSMIMQQTEQLKQELMIQKDMNMGLTDKISIYETTIRKLNIQNKEFDDHNQILMTENEKLTERLNRYECRLVNDELNNPLDAFFAELENITRNQIQLAKYFIETYNGKSQDNEVEQVNPVKKFFSDSNRKNRLLCLIDQEFLMTKIAEMRAVTDKLVEIKVMLGIITLADL